MDANAYTDRFFALEERLGLFADRSIGYHWWDAVRYDVFRFGYGQAAGIAIPVADRPPLWLRLRGGAERLALKARLRLSILLRHHDVLVLRAPRQFMAGQRSDLALDPLVQVCPGRHLVIDTFPHYYHLPWRPSRRSHSACPEVVPRLAEALRVEFGITTGEAALRELIVSLLDRFCARQEGYRKLFARVRPRLVLLTQNGMEKALFCAAREQGVRVIEAQHGLIGHAHPGYSYARSIDYRHLQSFPDAFATFSSYWSRACHYPAGECMAIGNDAFHVPLLAPPPGRGQVMFVSADIYHETLVDWLRPLALRLPERHFVYKLHPNQQHARSAIGAELASLPNVEIVDGSVSAGSLLGRVSHVVLIQSTVTHEALQAGRQVCILPLLNYQVHHDLFGLEGVTTTPTLEHLVRAIEAPPGTGKALSFFDRFDAARAAQLLTPGRPDPAAAAASAVSL